jgi:NAD(P)-dependent dehydrogenase (short-subunit alcohol dehydrogenase family)
MKYIIVGGTSGIGLATAKMAIDAGHEVIAVGRADRKVFRGEAITRGLRIVIVDRQTLDHTE